MILLEYTLLYNIALLFISDNKQPKGVRLSLIISDI